MKAEKLATAPQDIRTEWRRLNDVIDDVEATQQVAATHPQLVNASRTASGGIVIDCSGLIQFLSQHGIDATSL